MEHYKIYYARAPYAHFGTRHVIEDEYVENPLLIKDLARTHALVDTIESETRDAAFDKMQGKDLSDADYRLLRHEDVSHKAMSAGDVVEDPHGKFYEVMLGGWRIMM